MAANYVTCRVLSGRGVQCTAEAVDPGAELLICVRHLAEAQRLLQSALHGPGKSAPSAPC